MIVRILGEGRYDVPDAEIPAIEELDARLNDALEGDDTGSFHAALDALIGKVRQEGTLLPADDVQTSALVVPHEGSTLAEVRALLAEES